MSRIATFYRIRCRAAEIEARARAVAVEQSVEMPVAAIEDSRVLSEIVGQVGAIADQGDGSFSVRIDLALSTTGLEPGQMLNMLFGNSSILDDVTLEDATFPEPVFAAFGGPRGGMARLRLLARAARRAMTCSALKPQGLPVSGLADLAHRLALGGLDYIKDDHGLADQRYSPFADRVAACSEAIGRANRIAGGSAQYVPSIGGNLDQLRDQVARAKATGVSTVLIAPMIAGLANFHALVREFPDIAFIAHPAMAGAAKIAPPLLIGKLFRLFGADATVFPNHGGRFGYSPETCRALAEAARAPWGGLESTVPVPAGGMTVERVPEMLSFYGPDTMLLVGGGLLAAQDRLTEAAQAFTRRVAGHVYA